MLQAVCFLEYAACAEEILDILEQHAGGGTEFDICSSTSSTEAAVPM